MSAPEISQLQVEQKIQKPASSMNFNQKCSRNCHMNLTPPYTSMERSPQIAPAFGSLGLAFNASRNASVSCRRASCSSRNNLGAKRHGVEAGHFSSLEGYPYHALTKLMTIVWYLMNIQMPKEIFKKMPNRDALPVSGHMQKCLSEWCFFSSSQLEKIRSR